MGGTGKTPFLRWVLENIGDDSKVLISSRGYKSKSENRGALVRSNSDKGYSASEIGDENIELLNSLQEGSIAIGKNRTKLVKNALKLDSYDLIFLDDGFQHLKIQRDLNIVLFNSMMNCQLLRVFPSGVLREGLASLYNADIVIYTNCLNEKVDKNEARLRSRVSPFLT